MKRITNFSALLRHAQANASPSLLRPTIGMCGPRKQPSNDSHTCKNVVCQRREYAAKPFGGEKEDHHNHEVDLLFDLCAGEAEAVTSAQSVALNMASRNSSGSNHDSIIRGGNTTNRNATETFEENEADDLFAQFAEATASFTAETPQISINGAVRSENDTTRPLTAGSKLFEAVNADNCSNSNSNNGPDINTADKGTSFPPAFLRQRSEQFKEALDRLHPLNRLPHLLRAEFDATDSSNKQLILSLQQALAEVVKRVQRAEARYTKASSTASAAGLSSSSFAASEEKNANTIGSSLTYEAESALAVTYANALAALGSGVGAISPASPASVTWRCANDGTVFRARVRDRVEQHEAVQRVISRGIAFSNAEMTGVVGEKGMSPSVSMVESPHGHKETDSPQITIEELAAFHAHDTHHCPLCVSKAAPFASARALQLQHGSTADREAEKKESKAKANSEVETSDLSATDTLLVNSHPLLAATWAPHLNRLLKHSATATAEEHENVGIKGESKTTKMTEIPLSHVPTTAKRRFWWECGSCQRFWRESPLNRTTLRNGSPHCPRCHSRETLIANTIAPFSSTDSASFFGKSLTDVAPWAAIELEPSLALRDRPILDEAPESLMIGVSADTLGDVLSSSCASANAVSPTRSHADANATLRLRDDPSSILGTSEETDETLSAASLASRRKLRAEILNKWGRVPADSEQVARWKCSYCSYSYKMSVRERALMGKDCPSCTGTIVYNRHGGGSSIASGAVSRSGLDTERNPARLLVDQRPDIAKEIVGMSSVSIEKLSIADVRYFNFICRACLAPYRQRMRDRCAPHGGCPSCGGRSTKQRLTKRGYAERLERAARQQNRVALRDRRLFN